MSDIGGGLAPSFGDLINATKHQANEITRLRAELDEADARTKILGESNYDLCERIIEGDARIAELEAELGQLKRTVEFSEQEYLKEHGHWGSCPWKAKALELEARQPTEEQIDEAWRLHGPAVGTTALCVFRDLGIVACEKCDGSGEVPTPETYAIETDGWDEACRDCKGHGWVWRNNENTSNGG